MRDSQLLVGQPNFRSYKLTADNPSAFSDVIDVSLLATRSARRRDDFGLSHFQLTWFKDERGRESNYIECRTCIGEKEVHSQYLDSRRRP